VEDAEAVCSTLEQTITAHKGEAGKLRTALARAEAAAAAVAVRSAEAGPYTASSLFPHSVPVHTRRMVLTWRRDCSIIVHLYTLVFSSSSFTDANEGRRVQALPRGGLAAAVGERRGGQGQHLRQAGRGLHSSTSQLNLSRV
jgi:hypothetical protein